MRYQKFKQNKQFRNNQNFSMEAWMEIQENRQSNLTNMKQPPFGEVMVGRDQSECAGFLAKED